MNNNSKVVKVISIVLAAYMALSPMVVSADEIEDAENSVSVQIEVKEEAAENVSEAVENREETEQQIESFEAVVNEQVVAETESDVPVESEDPAEDTTVDTQALVSEKINEIENEVVQEAIKEAADAIVNVDMSGVDAALDTVSEIVDDTLTDETVAEEVIAAADSLIEVYETQSNAALAALTVIANETDEDAVEVAEDGSVSVDWERATQEVKDLYEVYQDALKKKNAAEGLLADVSEQKDAVEANAKNYDKDVLTKGNNETILNSKLDKNSVINNIIDEYAANKKSSFVTGYSDDQSIDKDICRFFVNKIVNGSVYGCVTYYDFESKTILRKNFSIEADGTIIYDYVPDPNWVKGNANSDESFGNGSNYVAAYVDKSLNDKYHYIDANNSFNGKNVSNLMRQNVSLNEAIDAIYELQEIQKVVAEAEVNLEEATEKANAALAEYKKAVEKYQNVASLEREIKNDNVEKAMLEYVKAEVEVYKKQQVLNQLEEALKDAETAEKEDDVIEPAAPEKNEVVVEENIQTVIDNIANNLGVAPEVVEDMVVQTIINEEAPAANSSEPAATAQTEDSTTSVASTSESVVTVQPVAATASVANGSTQIIFDTEDSDIIATNNGRGAAVAGARVNEAKVEEAAEETEAAKVVTKADTKKETVETTKDEAKKVVTIEENKTPLANVGATAEAGHSVNWWLLLVIALTCVAWMIFVIAKKNKKEEEA